MWINRNTELWLQYMVVSAGSSWSGTVFKHSVYLVLCKSVVMWLEMSCCAKNAFSGYTCSYFLVFIRSWKRIGVWRWRGIPSPPFWTVLFVPTWTAYRPLLLGPASTPCLFTSTGLTLAFPPTRRRHQCLYVLDSCQEAFQSEFVCHVYSNNIKWY
jgi:hypothetical protein